MMEYVKLDLFDIAVQSLEDFEGYGLVCREKGLESDKEI